MKRSTTPVDTIDLTGGDVQGPPKRARITPNSVSINLVDDDVDLVSLQVNQITQYFPSDLWSHTFKKASLHKYPIKVLLSLRTVCKSWKNVISSFTKISSPDIHTILQLPKLWTIFPLRALSPSSKCRKPYFLLMTSLTQLKIDSDGRYSANLMELLPLTNLTKLTIKANEVTSLCSLTSLESLYLKGFRLRVKQTDVDQLPHLTRLVTEDKNFWKHGRGIFKDLQKNKTYEGEFKDGKYHGQGILIDRRARFEGEFKEGHRNGQGKCFFRDGSRYEGQFEHTSTKVSGVYYSKGGMKITGDFFFEAGSKLKTYRNGEGLIEYPDGREYQGAFEAGRRSGVGIYKMVNSVRIEGPFVKGILHGTGRIVYPNGDKMRCTWKENMITGNAVVEHPNGDKFECCWDEKGAQGVGILEINRSFGTLGGEKIQGIWENGACTTTDLLAGRLYQTWKCENFHP